MTLFEILLEGALDDLFGGIQPEKTAPLPPLKDRIASAIKTGRLKPAINTFESIYFLERLLGKLLPQDRQMLIQNKAWYPDDFGDWVLDVRKIPGMAQPQVQYPPLPEPYRQALIKIVTQLKSGKISADNIYTGGSAFTSHGITQADYDILRKLGVIVPKVYDDMRGVEIDVNKLGEIRRQQKI